MTLLDLSADHRARSRFSDGADTLDEVVQRAERAGLTSLVVADRVDAGSDWLATYSRSLNRASRRTAMRLYCGVAADIVGLDGDLDVPAQLPGIEQLTVMSRLLPLPGGLVSAAHVRRLLSSGQLRPLDAVECLVTGYVNALAAASERAQAVLARPFSLLPDIGLGEEHLTDDVLRALAAGCRATGAMIEVNERLECPSTRVAGLLARAGVRLAAASDAYQARDIGRWTYAAAVADALPADVLLAGTPQRDAV